MIPPDVALALLINRCAAASSTGMPPYMSFEEHTHITGSAGFLAINKNVDRAVTVRTADAFAVMQDLPKGARRSGSAFPMPPAFDPFSTFYYSYYVNFGKIDIDYYPAQPYQFALPAPDPNVQMVVPYFRYWAPHYATDSSDQAVHLLIDPTPIIADNPYVSEIKVDPSSQLPSEMTLQMPEKHGLVTIRLDYAMIENHWILTHGVLDVIKHAGVLFKGHAETTFTSFTFPAIAPDPELTGTLRPSPTPAPSSQP
jgi:hypothetical protein